ncbi:Glutamyl-tRNA synthetase [Candidatus Phytoplasma pini]|uniref:Glutamate--tRNA ligase n=2 Tax=Candidatus Phytoplasma pini TaxID=267362 RepID=A0A559KJI9_9MOLU|nr:Glutamyl-tRNA synthetase [Candidatus Phytoplasma pini]
MIRVRYAPSPTGFLHIGNARTALFNYLFARRYKGDFIIRIEDTDLKRNLVRSEISQLEQLKWLGIEWTEGPDCDGPVAPYRQSERLSIYHRYTQFLLDKKMAYKIYSEDNKKFSVRFKVPPYQKYEFTDLIRGHLSFLSKDIEDWVIVKENGFPTYNYAAAIDDHLMKITHILRGEEHITNTPKQIMIYRSFGWEIPFFGHISLILNKKRKKLSKRDTDIIQFIDKYIDLGYLPEALLNFLFLLGFSPQSNKTIFSMDEIIASFDIKRLVKSPAIFDEQKLNFINSQYIKKMTLNHLVQQNNFFFQKSNIFLDEEWLKKFSLLFQNRISYFQEIINLYNDFFINNFQIKEETINFIKELNDLNVIQELYNIFSKLNVFDVFNVEQSIQQFSEKTKIKGKHLFIFIRLICTGQKNGPQLPIYLELLGKTRVLDNIKFSLSIMKEN